MSAPKKKKSPKNSGKAPSMQWYPADWRKDTSVQMLSFHDRGVWFELINIMHESAERGVLVVNGSPMPLDALARLLGLDNQTFNQTLSNLLSYGVAKRRESDGAIYSKRMVADEKLSQVRREAGKLGGNPDLLNQNPTTPVNQNPTPSSSTSSSTSSSKKNTPKPPEGGAGLELESEVSGRRTRQGKTPTTPQALRIAAIFKRRAGTQWDAREVAAFKALHPIAEEELAAVEAYYAEHWPPTRGKNVLRTNLTIFLNNFRGEVDRANTWARHPESTREVVKPTNPLSQFQA